MMKVVKNYEVYGSNKTGLAQAKKTSVFKLKKMKSFLFSLFPVCNFEITGFPKCLNKWLAWPKGLKLLVA